MLEKNNILNKYFTLIILIKNKKNAHRKIINMYISGANKFKIVIKSYLCKIQLED